MADRKIFIDDSPKDPNVKTSPFDLTFATNITGQFGMVKVPFLKYFPPKCRVDVHPNFAFDLHAFKYPVQTNVRAHFKLFSVPVRVLWDDAEDYFAMIGQDGSPTNAGGSQYVVPYIKRPTGWNGKYTLAEQLGCSNIRYDTVPVDLHCGGSFLVGGTSRDGYVNTIYVPITPTTRRISLGWRLRYNQFFTPNGRITSTGYNIQFSVLTKTPDTVGTLGELVIRSGRYLYNNHVHPDNPDTFYISEVDDSAQTHVNIGFYPSGVATGNYYREQSVYDTLNIDGVTVYRHYFNVMVSEPLFFSRMLQYAREGFHTYMFLDFPESAYSKIVPNPLQFGQEQQLHNDAVALVSEIMPKEGGGSSVDASVQNVIVHSNLGLSPYLLVNVEEPTDEINTLRDSINGADPKDPICALPFRAVEFIHNYFFRNPRIDPFYKDGKPTYNRFITNSSSGADETTPVDTWLAYYETDYFTSCVKEPQMGNAPLVGVTVNDLGNTGILTFSDGQGMNDYTVSLQIDGDGRVLPLSVYNDTAEHPNIHRLSELISAGISINDLRNVSTFQRMLERMQRTGYRFENVVFEFFGTHPPVGDRYPKYLGGISRNISVDKITQMAETEQKKLGEFGGTGKFRYPRQDEKPATISVYTTEPCYIVGILYFTVTPCYPQYTPKHFYYKDPLDWYLNPEFATIGPQPVYCKELAFGQLDESNLNDVFGYNRPYAEFFSSVDEVHGDFLGNMSNFLLQRWFSNKPQLNKSFIEVNPLDLTNIFAYVDNTDKIFGQMLFRVNGDLPAPRSYLPRSI